jgi:UDP-N-acetylmuramate dehydrogenase
MRICENFDLKYYNGYRINANCSKAFFPDTEDDIIELFSNTNLHPMIILGNGYNVILSKEHYDEHFVILNGCMNKITVNNTTITAETGTSLSDLSETALECSLSGLEVFSDIPGSVGGAICMNAGTENQEIKDYIIKVRYFNIPDREIRETDSTELMFGYRTSIFLLHKENIILKAWFEFKPGNKDDIKAGMIQTKQRRWNKQPRDYPNCGSVFKRPEGRFVGPMIEELGMKGFSVGGAQISGKHAGFIINSGNATGKEILSLIGEVQNRVKRKFGIDLQLEQQVF